MTWAGDARPGHPFKKIFGRVRIAAYHAQLTLVTLLIATVLALVVETYDLSKWEWFYAPMVIPVVIGISLLLK